MKADIHPEYREVLLHDSGADKYFLIPSTLETSETREYEGKTYPYYPLDISSASHPFYTGTQRIVDTGGRVQRFEKRFGCSLSRVLLGNNLGKTCFSTV